MVVCFVTLKAMLGFDVEENTDLGLSQKLRQAI
jgi:hypothetical protein